jgi:hypothetical protein
MTLALFQKFVYLVMQWQIEYPQLARQIEHDDVVYNARLYDEGHIGSKKSIGPNLPSGFAATKLRNGDTTQSKQTTCSAKPLKAKIVS